MFAKIYVPLFSPGADLLMDTRRRWVWIPREGSAHDMALPAEDRELFSNCFRYSSDLLGDDYSFVAAPSPDLIFSVDFRPQIPLPI